ncbi:hypothetical protein NM688_g8718 [Phlebia brevispora]|uniref:Uncharacterized protein n=1 Tax=Phlebia brevispora TaxID=194682 RepID=A0ACC1RP25_9APHY|nr:hypothetical protein NM688_g8718 [Phlebia brevispora]
MPRTHRKSVTTHNAIDSLRKYVTFDISPYDADALPGAITLVTQCILSFGSIDESGAAFLSVDMGSETITERTGLERTITSLARWRKLLLTTPSIMASPRRIDYHTDAKCKASPSDFKQLALHRAYHSALDHRHIPLYGSTSDGICMIYIYLLRTPFFPLSQAETLGEMSTTTADSAAVIAEYRANLAFNHCVNASLTIVCYDFIATLQYEYELIWHRKWTGATWLFLANRYLLCHNFSLMSFLNALTILPGIIVAVFSALRVFALLDRAYITASLTLILGLAGVALNFYQSSQVVYYYVNNRVLGSSCYYKYLLSPSAVFYSKKFVELQCEARAKAARGL